MPRDNNAHSSNRASTKAGKRKRVSEDKPAHRIDRDATISPSPESSIEGCGEIMVFEGLRMNESTKRSPSPCPTLASSSSACLTNLASTIRPASKRRARKNLLDLEAISVDSYYQQIQAETQRYLRANQPDMDLISWQARVDRDERIFAAERKIYKNKPDYLAKLQKNFAECKMKHLISARKNLEHYPDLIAKLENEITHEANTANLNTKQQKYLKELESIAPGPAFLTAASGRRAKKPSQRALASIDGGK